MLRVIAQGISLVFHPLLILSYMLVMLLLAEPYLFGVPSIQAQQSKELLLLIFLSTFAIPAFAVLMMKALGFIESLQMHDKQERTIPYIATGLFYMWLFRNLLDNINMPLLFQACVLGATIGLFVAFLINLFTKISAHAVGMGGLCALAIITLLQSNYQSFLLPFPILGIEEASTMSLLLLAVIAAGLVGSARLLLGAHTEQDLYGGYLVGFSTQFVAFGILVF